jgi:hypothetical protein
LNADRAPPLNRGVRCHLAMTVINYNGSGMWSVDEVLRRYTIYARRYRIDAPRDLKPMVHSTSDKQWIYPVMDRVIEGIESGDLACAELGVEFIEEKASFAFGMILKSNTARALRRVALTDEQKERIRKRVTEMLEAGYLPREFRQYAKLARKIGLGEWLATIEGQAKLGDPWVQHYYTYFKEQAPDWKSDIGGIQGDDVDTTNDRRSADRIHQNRP